MEKWDIEDYIEEIKFQMTEYEELTEQIILSWEAKAREWISLHADGKHIIKKSEDDISIVVKDEDIMYEIALRYHNAMRKGNVEEYWKKFRI